MSEEQQSRKKPDQAPALPPSDRPAIAASDIQAIPPGHLPVPLGPGERPSIAAAPPSPPLPGTGPLALPDGAPPAADPLHQAIDELLRAAKTIAVVGASDKPGKPSHRVFFYLLHAGFEVFPVNPTFKELGGRPAYPDLGSVPAKIDIVDIFRRPEQVGPVVDEAIAVGAKAVWMQEGIVNEEAAARARAAGLQVVMDRCVMKEHRRMKG